MEILKIITLMTIFWIFILWVESTGKPYDKR